MAFPDARAAVIALAERTATLADLREIVTAFPQLRPVVAAYQDTDDALLAWLRDLHDPLVDAQLAKRGAAAPMAAPNVAEQPTVAAQPITPVYLPFVRPEQPTVAPQSIAPVYTPFETSQQPTVAPQPIPPGYTPFDDPEPPRKRPVWPLVVAVVAALVVLGGGVGAAFATGLIGGSAATPARSTKPARPQSVEPSSTPAAGQSGTAESSASPSPAVTGSAASAGFTCWDSSAVKALGECKRPSGKDADWSYLKYVYPSIATHVSCEKADSTGKSTYTGITLMWECELGDAMIRYRYWAEPDDATTHYGKKFNAKTTLKTFDILVGGEPASGWAKTDKDTVAGPRGVRRVVMTMWLPEEQLSLSVEGDTSKTMWAAFDQVRTRPIAQALGHPSGEEPAEAPITTKAR